MGTVKQQETANSENVHHWHSSPNSIRKIKSRMEQMQNECKVLFGKPKGKRSSVKLRRAWEDNINGIFKKLCDDVASTVWWHDLVKSVNNPRALH
jgi:hypothetical protein